jgi:hypothetical protein
MHAVRAGDGLDHRRRAMAGIGHRLVAEAGVGGGDLEAVLQRRGGAGGGTDRVGRSTGERESS